MTTKICTDCKVEKPMTKEFFNVKSSNKSGFNHLCRPCHKDYQFNYHRRWRAAKKQQDSIPTKKARRELPKLSSMLWSQTACSRIKGERYPGPVSRPIFN